MNGRRRLLLGTVLSIHNTSFTYPACRSCFSRLIHTANRYQCQKCGETYPGAAQRYRLCVKVAEDHKLHMVTVFGSCLERIFGSSADSLHRYLQECERPLCDAGGDKARPLLFQAAEDCLIGRSFIFTVKVPDHLPREGSISSSHLVACQIIPINDDPTISILTRYRHLEESILSNSSINTRHELSAHSAHKAFRGLADSDGSLHHSGNQFADYWQQSLGLTSTPNTSAESPSCSPPSTAKEQSCEGRREFDEGNVLAQSSEKPEDLKVIVKDHLYLPKNSPPRVKNSSPTRVGPHTGCNPCSSRASRLSSRVSCRHYRRLQNVCNSSSYGCQDSSACCKRFPSQSTQSAESHQVENGTWDEFPFSESLSEFIARLENSEEERFHFSVKENKLCASDRKEELYEGHSKMAPDLIKTPCTSLATSSKEIKNKPPTKTVTPHCLGDVGSNALQSKDPCEIIPSDDPGSEGLSSSSASKGLLQKSLIGEDSIVSVASPSYPSLSSHHKTFPPMNENALYIATDHKRNLQISNYSQYIDRNINKLILSVRQYSSSLPKETEDVGNERRLEDLSPLRSDNLEPANVSPGSYNASADLFEDAEELLGETLLYKPTRSLKSQHGKKVGSFETPPSWESPCTDVIVRRNSQFQASYMQEVHETEGTIHGLLSCLQSTPILRPLSESTFLNSDPRAPVLSRRSSHSLHFLLKKMKQSLSRGSSNVCSDNFRFSPISTEMSSRQVFQRRRTLVIKSRKKKMILDDNENCNIRSCNGRSGEGGDSSIVTRREMDPSEMDIAEDGVTAFPLTSPLYMCAVQKPLPSDWSPELFNEMSNISKQSDTLQRRLF